jgi:hypothetical protein
VQRLGFEPHVHCSADHVQTLNLVCDPCRLYELTNSSEESDTGSIEAERRAIARHWGKRWRRKVAVKALSRGGHLFDSRLEHIMEVVPLLLVPTGSHNTVLLLKPRNGFFTEVYSLIPPCTTILEHLSTSPQNI